MRKETEQKRKDRGSRNLIEEVKIRELLKIVKKMGRRKDDELGSIFYGDNPINYQNLMYSIRVDKGRPLITMEDKGRCPAYAQTIGYELFNELFGYHLTGGPHDRRPSFENIELELGLFGNVNINLNKGICPFDVHDAQYNFRTKRSFENFVKRLKNEKHTGAVESIEDLFHNLEPAVTEFISKYRGTKISLINENGIYVPKIWG